MVPGAPLSCFLMFSFGTGSFYTEGVSVQGLPVDLRGQYGVPMAFPDQSVC